MNRAERADTMKRLQKQIAAMHPLAMNLMSEHFPARPRRKFLEGVPIWAILELSDAFNRLCAEDRRELKASKPITKRKRSPAP
jgi:hypothetical protein